MTIAQSLAPSAFVIPIAFVAMALLTVHVVAVQLREPWGLRRRIRSANGLLMLVLVAVLAYALGIASPSNPRPFVLAWMSVVGLVGLVLVVAVADAAATVRSHRARLRRIRERASGAPRERTP